WSLHLWLWQDDLADDAPSTIRRRHLRNLPIVSLRRRRPLLGLRGQDCWHDTFIGSRWSRFPRGDRGRKGCRRHPWLLGPCESRFLGARQCCPSRRLQSGLVQRWPFGRLVGGWRMRQRGWNRYPLSEAAILGHRRPVPKAGIPILHGLVAARRLIARFPVLARGNWWRSTRASCLQVVRKPLFEAARVMDGLFAL